MNVYLVGVHELSAVLSNPLDSLPQLLLFLVGSPVGKTCAQRAVNDQQRRKVQPRCADRAKGAAHSLVKSCALGLGLAGGGVAVNAVRQKRGIVGVVEYENLVYRRLDHFDTRGETVQTVKMNNPTVPTVTLPSDLRDRGIPHQPRAIPPHTETQMLITRVGLVMPTNLNYDDWKQAGPKLFRIANSSAWCLGDWLAYGQQRFHNRYKRAAEEAGLDTQTLRIL